VKYDTYALMHTVPIAVIGALAARDVMPLLPWAGWMMAALSVVSAAMTVEILAGWPVVTAWADSSWRLRQAREGGRD
jgi:hypothetical protein